jgi:hypothetical protein
MAIAVHRGAAGAAARAVQSARCRRGDAVAVYFKTKKLGYVPRAENRVVAQMLDRGEYLEANISELWASENPWERILINITLV